jgi:hypothetical protein
VETIPDVSLIKYITIATENSRHPQRHHSEKKRINRFHNKTVIPF